MSVFYIIISIIIVLLLLGALFLRSLFKGVENSRREKFGENYELAMNDETTPVECKPDPKQIAPALIRERTGIDFPPFEVESCVSLLRHFTGDYRERVKIRFERPIDDILATIMESERWNSILVENEICYACSHRDKHGYWAMRVMPDKPQTATISYGR